MKRLDHYNTYYWGMDRQDSKPKLSRSQRRKQRLGELSEPRDRVAPDTVPISPRSEPAYQFDPGPSLRELREDLGLARRMVEGNWQTPSDARLRLINRLAQAANPENPITVVVAAVNAITKIDDHLLKQRLATSASAAKPIEERALQILRDQSEGHPDG